MNFNTQTIEFDVTYIPEERNSLGQIFQEWCFSHNPINKSIFTKEYVTLPDYTAKFSQPIVSPKNGLLMAQDGSLWTESKYLVDQESVSEFLIRNKSENLQGLGVANVGEGVLLRNGGSHNYFHWHINCLPVVLELRDYVKEKNICFILDNLSEWQKQSLKYLGVEVEIVRELGDVIVKCKELVYSSRLARNSNTPRTDLAKIFREIQSKHIPSIKQKNELIFISRNDVYGRRTLTNENVLIKKLQAYGFEVLTPGLLSYDEQIDVFSSAKVIIASHGAGLVNMVWAKPNCVVIELFSPKYINNCFWRLSQIIGHRYVYIIGEIEQDEDLDHNKTPFYISIEAVEKAILYFLTSTE